MSTFRTSDLLWLTTELNPFLEDSSQSGPKTLTDFCSEKLISDVWLLRQVVLHIPKKIFSILLSKAIDKNRILSAAELIKYSPFEEIELSIPNALRDLSTIEARKNNVEMDELKKFYGVALSIFSAFLEIISKRRRTSQLKRLNLGFLPVDKRMLKLLGDFIEKVQKIPRHVAKNLKYNPKDIKNFHEVYKSFQNDLECCLKPLDLQGQYTLKCTLLLEEAEEILDILRLYILAKAIGFELTITGMIFYNLICPALLVSEITKVVRPQDFQLLAVIFSDFNPSSEFVFSELKQFKDLKYLNMSHMRCAFNEESSLKEFSASLAVLTNLKRLVLRNIKLTGCLSYLFCEFCNKILDPGIVTKCCLAHCGSLESLDVSGCCLSGEDIGFLKELSVCNCLKYLDISDNSLEVASTLQTLLFLSSSLLVLNMANCFRETVEYNSETFPLRTFTQIRILNIKGMKMTDTNKQMLYSELEKMTFECIKTDNEPPYDAISYEQFTALHCQQS